MQPGIPGFSLWVVGVLEPRHINFILTLGSNSDDNLCEPSMEPEAPYPRQPGEWLVWYQVGFYQ